MLQRFALAGVAAVVAVGMASVVARGQSFSANFNSLSAGALIPQDGWTYSYGAVYGSGGFSIPVVVAGGGPDGSNALSGAGALCGADHPLAFPYYYNATDRAIIWSMRGYVPSGSGASQAVAQGSLDTALGAVGFGLDREALSGNVLKAVLYGRNGAHFGDTLTAGHWYQFQLTIDFGQAGGAGTLQYKDLTAGQTQFTTDSQIVNTLMGMPASGGNYTMYSAGVRLDSGGGAAKIDDVVLGAPLRGGGGTTKSISLQAKLDGVTGPTANLTVRFFDAPTGGTQVTWNGCDGSPDCRVDLANVAVQNGVVSAIIPISDPAGFAHGANMYMVLRVNGGAELSPRTLVTSVPYAMTATNLDSPGMAIAGNNLFKYPAYALRTYDDPSLHPEPCPSFYGTNFYRAVGSGWEPHTGFGFYIGSNFASPAVWMYNAPNNRFQVNRIGYNQSMDQAEALLTVGSDGVTGVRVLTIVGADVAEPFNVAKSDTAPEPTPGMVVSIDPANPGKLMVSSTPYDRKVAGAISGAGGLSVGVVMGKDNADPLIKGDHPVAMSGRVYVWCDASTGAIEPGDMLTTSATPGHAMKAADQSKAFGAVIGKAMTGLKDGKGLVLVLVNLE